MIAELGHFALILALAASLAQAFLLLAGAARGDAEFLAAGRHASVVQAALVGAAFASLAGSFLVNDYSVRTVALHSHSSLPDAYRIAAAWGSPEGSMLLWATAQASWTLAFRFASRRLPMALSCRALGILGLVSSGVLAVAIAGTSPFARLVPAPAEGRALNPLLQDPGMLLHPPLIFAGYSGLAVVFALALGALLGGRLDAAWARWSRPWALVAWSALTLGIWVGCHWSYRELGWGGWWSWDPVQNATLMPWVAGTALLHSLAVAEKRGLFRRWTVLLAILAFALSLLGIFLARSGTPSSVHDFASDPQGSGAILVFLAVTVVASAALAARRPGIVDGEGRWEMISREAAIAAGNAVLLTVVGAVLLGTLYPLVAATPGPGRLAVGPSYFASVFLPLVLPGLALLGPAPRLRWGSESAGEAIRDAIRPGLAAACAAAGAILGVERPTAWLAIGVFLATWIAMHAVEALAYRSRTAGAGGPWHAVAGAPASFHAMHCAHLGVAVLVAGIALSSALEQSAEVVLAPGMTESVGSLRVRSEGLREVEGPNYRAVRARLVVFDGEREIVLEPERRLYRSGGQAVSESAVHASLARDLHVSLAEPSGRGAWTVRVRIKPFMGWIWCGALLMAFGGLLAATDRRYRSTWQAGRSRANAALVLAEGAPR